MTPKLIICSWLVFPLFSAYKLLVDDPASLGEALEYGFWMIFPFLVFPLWIGCFLDVPLAGGNHFVTINEMVYDMKEKYCGRFWDKYDRTGHLVDRKPC